jgi:hypothetical protein
MYYEFQSLLDEAVKETQLQSFLERHPDIIVNTFYQGAYYPVVFPKFHLADEFIPDFVMIGRRSGSAETSWDVDLIEIEPAILDKPLFNKKRQSTGRLRIAEAQIMDWQRWMQKYEQRIFVPKAFEQLKSKKVWDDHPQFYTPTTGTYQDVVVWYRIIIGRRKDFNGWGNQYRNLIWKKSGNRVEIVPWDRLLDRVKQIENCTD